MNKIMVDKNKCTGCKICQVVCSTRFSGGGVNIKNAALRVKEIDLYEGFSCNMFALWWRKRLKKQDAA